MQNCKGRRHIRHGRKGTRHRSAPVTSAYGKGSLGQARLLTEKPDAAGSVGEQGGSPLVASDLANHPRRSSARRSRRQRRQLEPHECS